MTPAITLAELRTSDEDIPPDLYEAARREKKLKARIRELVDTLENLSKNAESRHQQAGEYIADLKRANGALVAAYEKAKRKHTTRVKKLESQMMTMMEKHEKQVGLAFVLGLVKGKKKNVEDEKEDREWEDNEREEVDGEEVEEEERRGGEGWVGGEREQKGEEEKEVEEKDVEEETDMEKEEKEETKRP